MALSPGSKLGSYEVLSAIGAGGMGEVYRARDLRLGREVAIKVLPGSVARSGCSTSYCPTRVPATKPIGGRIIEVPSAKR
jgi:serine/threonine protein kinase